MTNIFLAKNITDRKYPEEALPLQYVAQKILGELTY